MRRPISAFVDRSLMSGVCGVPPGAELILPNWTHWQLDCSQQSIAAKRICMRVDGDPHNDAEPWQEIEHVIFERWSLPSALFHTADEIRAELHVVPSALAHCRHPGGWFRHSWWNPAMVDGRSDVHVAYWEALRQRDARRTAKRAALNLGPQFTLLIYDGTWQMDYGVAMLQALAKQEPSFVRRLLIASIESPMQIRAHARAFSVPSASPTFISVPFAILLRDAVQAQ